MSDSNPLLTIAIPTYNRPDAIRKQVRNLLTQTTPSIRLIIYDNASPVPVDSLFTDEEKKRFEIRRNPVNIGAEANIARCIEACASSEWGYVLGDDDELLPDAVSRILSGIAQHPDAVFINFGCAQDEVLSSEDDCLCSLGRNVFSFGDALWISKGIFHTALMRDCYSDMHKYAFTFAPQIIFLLSHLQRCPDAKTVRLTEPLFDVSAPGGWSSLDFGQRLFPFYDFWPMDKRNQRGPRCFLDNLLVIQMHLVWVNIIKSKAQCDAGAVRLFLKKLFIYRGLFWFLRNDFREMLVIMAFRYFPFGKTILHSILLRHPVSC